MHAILVVLGLVMLVVKGLAGINVHLVAQVAVTALVLVLAIVVVFNHATALVLVDVLVNNMHKNKRLYFSLLKAQITV